MITLAFFSGTGISSRAIEWFSAGNLSHVAAVMPDGNYLDSRSDCEGAAAPGVQIRPRAIEGKEEAVRFVIPCTEQQEKLFWEFLHSQVGKPYDVPGILAFVTNRDWREPDSWFCSELDSAALEYAGIVKRLYLPANKVTPVALALVASVLGTAQAPGQATA